MAIVREGGAPGSPVVLVVEDEEIVRQFAVETLQEAGFEVLDAGGADDALRVLALRSDVKVMVSEQQQAPRS